MKHKMGIGCLVTLICLVSILFSPQASHVQAKPQLQTGSGEWTCWDDGSLDPCHLELETIDLISSTEGWAGGEGGRLLRLHNGSWSIYSSPTTLGINDIEMVDANDGWLAAGFGHTYHWDGSSWNSHYIAPGNYNILSLSIVTSDDIWAAGYYLYHWDGSSWNTTTTSQNIKAVSMVPGSSGGDGWAVGSNGTILRWNGSTWGSFTSPTSASLEDVKMISESDGWAVGYEGTVLHWDGTSWTVFSSFPASNIATIWELAVNTANDIWAIGFDNGANGIYHWNGTEWLREYTDYVGTLFNGVDVTPGSGGNEAYVVGRGGYMTKWDGTDWSAVNDPYIAKLFDIEMFSKDEGWAAGTDWIFTSGDVLQWDGTNWGEYQTIDAYDFEFVPGSSGTEGWAVGVAGNIYQWDNSSWSLVGNPDTVSLKGLDIINNDDAWAVGGGYDLTTHNYRGSIVRLENGDWTTFAGPTSKMLADVDMLSSAEGWAVGEEGTILQWNGSNWQTQTSPTSEDLNAVYFFDSSNGWAVGDWGTVLSWDGSNWNVETTLTAEDLEDVTFFDENHGWAVGDVILKWDGTGWYVIAKPATPKLTAIAYASQSELWAVGWEGVIMHYGTTPELSVNYSSGVPGSYFTFSGTDFPPDETVMVYANTAYLGAVTSDSSGNISFILSTMDSDEGAYLITASTYDLATGYATMDQNQIFLYETGLAHPQEGTYDIFDVPEGIAFQMQYLPMVIR